MSSKFFACRNLTEKAFAEVTPWEFSPAESPSEKVRHDKIERQAFYHSPATVWQFYTAIEPANPNQRISKENPPLRLHGLVADYDVVIPDTRIDEVIAEMKHPPAWVERSLGGKTRLVWPLVRPILLDGTKHAAYVLQEAVAWLSLGLLPGLDEGAFTDPARLLCNGAVWRSTGKPPIDDPELQAFVVKTAQSYNFSPAVSGNKIPLDAVEAQIRKVFPSFGWPSDFILESQGPSWWVPGSTSPMSAIVKDEGMLTFSDHAEKPFYTWTDILGKDFTKEFADASISKATNDIWFDSKNWWRRIKGVYKPCGEKEMNNHFKVACGMTDKKTIDEAFNHLFNECRVDGAAPFMFRPEGRIQYMGNPVLNIASARVLPPVAGEYPFLAAFLPRLFLNEEQYIRWRAWFQYFYKSGLEQRPRPGQAIFMLGPPGIGKGFCSHEVVGKAMGGFTDASAFLVNGDTFGSENFHRPVLCIDDETPGGNAAVQERFGAMVKKAVANQEFKYHAKFQVPTMVEWSGRVIVTVNLDYASTRILIPMDNSNLDKICIFRCTSDESIKELFPERYELQSRMLSELPAYLYDLVNWVPPDSVPRDGRFGYGSFHDPALLDQTHQTSRSAPFKEILLEELTTFFKNSPEATEWRGNVTQLYRLMLYNPLNDGILRKLSLDHINRYIEQIAREGLIKCTAETGDAKTRVWIIAKPELSAVLPIFSK